MSTTIVVLSACVAFIFGACSRTRDDVASTLGQDASEGTEFRDFEEEEGLSISEAQKVTSGQIVAVTGHVLQEGQGASLCEVLAESYPPQCGGAKLVIANPEATGEIPLTEAQGVRWSEEYVVVLGRISDGHLTIETAASG